jgi:hypothetical protein
MLVSNLGCDGSISNQDVLDHQNNVNCTDDCKENARRCKDDGTQTCIYSVIDSCLKWSDVQPCLPDFSCREQDGQCVANCQDPEYPKYCNGVCVNLMTDHDNCGACGNKLDWREACLNGEATSCGNLDNLCCSAPMAPCADTNGTIACWDGICQTSWSLCEQLNHRNTCIDISTVLICHGDFTDEVCREESCWDKQEDEHTCEGNATACGEVGMPCCYDIAHFCNSGTCNQDRYCECVPLTCTDLGKECGNWDDGCGATTQCNDCSDGEFCDSDGFCRCPEEYPSCGTSCCDPTETCLNDSCCPPGRLCGYPGSEYCCEQGEYCGSDFGEPACKSN